MASDPTGGFTVSDTTGDTSTDMNTLFGVNANVGQAPVILQNRIPGNNATRGETFDRPRAGTSTTLTDVLKGFYGMDPDALAQLQQQLYAGGFYGDGYYSGKTPKQPQLGVPDEDSFAAFKKAATRAARSGTALPDVLDQAVTSFSKSSGTAGAGGTSGPGGSAAQARPIQLTSDADLRATFTSAIKNRTGKNPDPAILQRMVDSYHKAEVDSQMAAYGAQDAQGGNPQYTQAPNPSTYANEQIQQLAPGDVGVHDALGAFDTFMGMLKASG